MDKIGSLRYVIAAGEVLPVAMTSDFYALSKRFCLKMELVNLYGPTESCIYTTYYNCKAEKKTVPIGKPINNTQIFIVSGEKLCGIGIPGELYIAGDGLARGYLNRPELTEEKFISNPYGKGKMYRTGDLARWLNDGNIEFMGRIDEQVKIRGFRIELGEIESVIRGIDYIKDVAVILRNDASGEKALHAYVVSDEELSIQGIKDMLRKFLMEYMIPPYMMQIESIPVTRNGKSDRQSLPEIVKRSEREYVAPRNETEVIMCRIFGEVLGLEEVGIHNSFFELGGNSLLAIKLEVELQKNNIDFKINNVFRYQTVESLAGYINYGRENNMTMEITKSEIEVVSEKKLIKGKLLEMTPFNDVFYKSCFFNAMFPILKYYDKNIFNYLIDDVLVYEFPDSEGNLELKYLEKKSFNMILENDGIEIYGKEYCEDILVTTIESLKDGHPVIITCDLFYLTIREDAYNRHHWNHMMLVNGYDIEKQIFYVIDNKHRDNLSYEKRQVLFDDLKKSYYASIKINQDVFTYMEIFENKKTERIFNNDFKNMRRCMIENQKMSLVAAENSIYCLKNFVIKFAEVAGDEKQMNEKADGYMTSINHIINAKEVEKYRLEYLFGKDMKQWKTADNITELWKNVRINLGRYLFSGIYNEIKLAKCITNLEKVIKEEQEFINLFQNEKENIF